MQNSTSETFKQQFVDPSKFDQKFLDSCAKKFLDACQAGEIEDYKTAYFFPAYFLSKVLVNAYTRLLAQRVAKRQEGKKIYVNCLDPGVVDTDMFKQWRETIDDAAYAQLKASGMTVVSTEQAADTPVWLSLMPAGGPSGLFWQNRKELSYFG